jgi:hypothetical protein
MATDQFYRQLKTFTLSITEVFNHPEYFAEFPGNWHIIISDIKNSTSAVAAGKGNDVNMVAAGSLVAALNIARQNKIEIPFFFGGDGISVVVPELLLGQIKNALLSHQENSLKNFGLELHMGSMEISQINAAGHSIQVAKVKVSGSYNKPIVIGDGFRFAEKIIKQSYVPIKPPETDADLDLNGLECRWNKIKPPLEENEIVCYLIEATRPGAQMKIYYDVLKKIDDTYGNTKTRNPISKHQLKLKLTYNKIRTEMILKFKKWNLLNYLTTYIETFLGIFYFKFFRGGKQYVQDTIAFADTLTIEGRINTVISGLPRQRMELVDFLKKQEEAGMLIFGYHICRQCVMTCYIENRKSKHIHFVDGDDGGYTQAAKKLKKKLADMEI